MKTIGLCMIVKNEAHVILRCLESVRPLIDYVVIEDSTSTDGTQEIINSFLTRENLPGEIFDPPWQDFGHNRSLALARLRERADIDYALMIDADDYVVFEKDFDPIAFKKSLDADCYDIELRSESIVYSRPQICSNHKAFRYRGVAHEYLESPPGCTSQRASGFYITSTRDGVRSADPDKYRKTARVLEQALQTENDSFLRSRYTFYLGMSWRDCGKKTKALASFTDRSTMGYWNEEIYVSLYWASQIKEELERPDFEIIGSYLKAYEALPTRGEALHGAARYCRQTGNFHQGYLLARQGLEIFQPESGLFLEPWVYRYGLLDEFAINAYWAGHYRDCLDACQRLLHDGTLPDDMRERIEGNARFARERLPLAEVTPHRGQAKAQWEPSVASGGTEVTAAVEHAGSSSEAARAPIADGAAHDVTFNDVMLNWAISELLSPTCAALWTGPECEDLRSKIRNEGILDLSIYEKLWLIGTIVQIRSPLISVYGPYHSWGFQKKFISIDEVKRFSIVRHVGYPSLSFGEFSDKIREAPSGDEKDMRDRVFEILRGESTFGLPIAIVTESSAPPILIEGYKRTMAALWGNQVETIEMFLCSPAPFKNPLGVEARAGCRHRSSRLGGAFS